MFRTATVVAHALIALGSLAQGPVGHYESVVGETLDLNSDSTYQYFQSPGMKFARISTGTWTVDGDSLRLTIYPNWDYDGPMEYFYQTHFVIRGKRLYYVIKGVFRENWFFRRVKRPKADWFE